MPQDCRSRAKIVTYSISISTVSIAIVLTASSLKERGCSSRSPNRSLTMRSERARSIRGCSSSAFQSDITEHKTRLERQSIAIAMTIIIGGMGNLSHPDFRSCHRSIANDCDRIASNLSAICITKYRRSSIEDRLTKHLHISSLKIEKNVIDRFADLFF
jgi:hypothetical protein